MPLCMTFLAVALLQAVHGEMQCEGPVDGQALVQSRKQALTANATQPFATVPVKWVIITKTDGTGRISEAAIKKTMAALNKRYSGGDPEEITEELVKKLNAATDVDSCNAKCDIQKCSGSPLAHKLTFDETCKAQCAVVVCESYSEYGRLYGPRADMNIEFKTANIQYIVNDVWHEQCCCAHAAGLDYEEKQVEIIDKVVDKTKVRSEVTAIVCNMKSTAGMSNIFGKAGGTTCAGGPWVMLDNNFQEFTLAHEFGHFFGLHHTFNDYCPSGDKWGTCPTGTDVCDETMNHGDRISDTPVHKKNGFCTVGADTCPNSAGKDPLDNMMSYSACKLRRFTPDQVKRAHETLTDYFPALLTSSSGKKPKDFACDPEFPNGYKDGYKFASTTAPRPAPKPAPKDSKAAPTPPTPPKACSQDALCTSSSVCCSGYGCGASTKTGIKGCAPCDWKAFDYFFSADSCKAASQPTPTPRPAKKAPAPAPKPRPAKKAPCSTDALCTTGSVCCSSFGCGASTKDGLKGCAPCGWKDFGYFFTSDSCETG